MGDEMQEAPVEKQGVSFAPLLQAQLTPATRVQSNQKARRFDETARF